MEVAAGRLSENFETSSLEARIPLVAGNEKAGRTVIWHCPLSKARVARAGLNGQRTVVIMTNKNPILDLPLNQVLRPEIALPLQQVLHLYTVGNFLRAWKSLKTQRSIEQLFETPSQARHAAQVCATWLGVNTVPAHEIVSAWWRHDDEPQRLSA
jgi:hypothetical protein